MISKHDILAQTIGEDLMVRHAQLIGDIKREVTAMMSSGTVRLTMLSRRLLISRGHLNRKVKSTLGITLQQLTALIQVDHAARLMLNSPNLKIHEVATLSGFDSASAFSRTFRRVTAMSPSQYIEYYNLNKQ